MARIVLIHGAFVGAAIWEPALPGLREAGHQVEAIDLPGSGDDPTPVADVTLDAHAERICRQLAEGPPAVLVGQSMGGMSITHAAARCPENITMLVYVAAFVPADGQSLMDLVAYPEAADDQVQANMVVEGDPPVAILSPEGGRIALFNCATGEQASWGAERLGPQPVAPMEQPMRVIPDKAEKFGQLPRAYVLCTQDRAIPPAMQRRMLKDAGCEPVIELNADHNPWLSRTEETVAALDRLASGT
jgi:pimeloyl-ACP methyl ester carboxylesterase